MVVTMAPSVIAFLPSLVVFGGFHPLHLFVFIVKTCLCIHTQAYYNNTQFSVGVVSVRIAGDKPRVVVCLWSEVVKQSTHCLP